MITKALARVSKNPKVILMCNDHRGIRTVGADAPDSSISITWELVRNAKPP